MPRTEQPELVGFELTQFAIGPMPGDMLQILQWAGKIDGIHRPYARQIEAIARRNHERAIDAIKSHSEFAGEIGYKYLRSRSGDSQ